MKRATKMMCAAALVVTLAALPFAGCATQNSSSSEQGGSQAAAQDDTAEISSYKTVGDLFDAASQDPDYSYNDSYMVLVFNIDDSYVRCVVKIDDELTAKLDELDILDDDYNKQFAEALQDVEFESVEDITSQQLSEDDLKALVGKTGQDLIDEGFVFESYNFYGGEDAGASMAKGYFSYMITFDAQVTDDDVDDEGKAILGASVTEAIMTSVSDSSIDPEQVDAAE